MAAQGPIMRERWTYAELQRLRGTLMDECRDRDPAVLAGVALDLLADAQGETFRPALVALARLRGVDADPAFLYRGTLRVVARPEVVDPDGANLECRDLHVTFYLPYAVEDPGPARFSVTVENQAGEKVWEDVVERGTGLDDLLRYRTSRTVRGAQLLDGSYTVSVQVFLDGEAKRPTDPATSSSFWVLRGFQERAEALFRRRQAMAGVLDPLPTAILHGVVAQVARVYASEPAAGAAQPPEELLRAEQVAANLERGAPALTGLQGRVDLALPAGGDQDEVAFVTLRLPEAGDEERPLVLFLPGSPSFDHGWNRPSSPRSTAPGWWADLLGDMGFDRQSRWHWAVMESPGRVSNSNRAVLAVLSALGDLLPIRQGQVCLVGERQGAWVASHTQTSPDAPGMAGLVLMVGGGNLSLEKLRDGGPAVLGIPAQGHASSVALERLADRAGADRLPMLEASTRPWPLVLGVSLVEIEEFLEKLLSGR